MEAHANVCSGLPEGFYVFWETTRHAHAHLPFCLRRSSSHHGQFALRVPRCLLVETPRLRPLVCCRKQRIPDRRVLPILTRLTPHALALTPGPARYCRGEPSPVVKLVCGPPRQDCGGVLTVPLVGVLMLRLGRYRSFLLGPRGRPPRPLGPSRKDR